MNVNIVHRRDENMHDHYAQQAEALVDCINRSPTQHSFNQCITFMGRVHDSREQVKQLARGLDRVAEAFKTTES